MLRAARIKFVAVTMFILLALFIVMGSTVYGLMYNKTALGTDKALDDLLLKIPLNGLEEGIEIPRSAVLGVSASGGREYFFDEMYFTIDEVDALYDAAQESGEKTGRIDNVFFRILVEKNGGTTFIAVDRTLEKNFERQFATFLIIVMLVAYILLFFVVWGFSYLVMKPVQNAFVQQNEFISDAGHELKTPIAIISASADVLALEQEDNEYVKNILTQTRRMNALISDLLSLAKMDETKALLDNAEQDLSALIGKCVLQFDALAFEREKEIVTDFEPDIAMPCDKTSVEKIVSILIDNALKYADGKEIYCTLKKSGDKAVFTVHNECRTLRADSKNKIFERFFRADNSRTRETGGSGLGLSIAKKIADINKWKISAHIEDRKSVTFFVVF